MADRAQVIANRQGVVTRSVAAARAAIQNAQTPARQGNPAPLTNIGHTDFASNIEGRRLFKTSKPHDAYSTSPTTMTYYSSDSDEEMVFPETYKLIKQKSGDEGPVQRVRICTENFEPSHNMWSSSSSETSDDTKDVVDDQSALALAAALAMDP